MEDEQTKKEEKTINTHRCLRRYGFDVKPLELFEDDYVDYHKEFKEINNDNSWQD
jgi:hypothetical protein